MSFQTTDYRSAPYVRHDASFLLAPYFLKINTSCELFSLFAVVVAAAAAPFIKGPL